MELLVNVIGWAGASMVLLAYALVSNAKVEASSFGYQMLNLLGGAGLAVNTFYFGSYPSTALNLVWMLIAIVALWRVLTPVGA